MSKRYRLGVGALVAVMLSTILGGATSAWAQDIMGFHDGYLTFTNENPALYYRVEFRPNLTGPEEWDGAFRGLRNIHSSDAEVTVPVGRFYRVVGRDTPWVAGTALESDILSGKTAYVDDEEVTGTMANVGQQNLTPGTAAQTITQGYHDGTGEVAGDADLVAGNIVAGKTIFTVAGTVVESTGNATAAQVLSGATFSKAGEADLTGTMANQENMGFMPGASDVTIPAGYYSGSGVVTGDAALVTGNIRSGVTIFGVAGKPEVVDTTSGDAAAEDLLEGKKVWVDGVEVTGTVPAGGDVAGENGALAIAIPAGLYSGSRTATAGDANLLPANIREGVTIFGVTGTGEDMALIPEGNFFKTNYPDGSKSAKCYISAFYMSRTHITKAQWNTVRRWARDNGYTDLPFGKGKGADHPVHSVTWYNVVKWCNARSEMEGRPPAYYTDGTHATVYRTGDLDLTNACVAWTTAGYRLPTESEWRKAARGGLYAHRFPWGHTANKISHAQANFRNDGGEAYQYGTTGYHPDYNTGDTPYTSPVGSFAPNGYGLYDMAGNLWDWCWDRYAIEGYYVAGSDPHGPDTGSYRMKRGGDWHGVAGSCRFVGRSGGHPSSASYFNGFRVVLPPGQ